MTVTVCFFKELTGKLSFDYPLMPNEKPPQIRRRVGASFKLDEELLPHRDGEVQKQKLIFS